MKRVRRGLSRDRIEKLRHEIEARATNGDPDIGGIIRDIRLVLRMSQAEYARRCGVALRVLSQIEAGDGNPGFLTVGKLLQPFGLRLGVIAGADSATVEVPADGSDATATAVAAIAAAVASTGAAAAIVATAGGPLAASERDRALAVACAVVVPDEGLALFDSMTRSIIGSTPSAHDSATREHRGRDLFSALNQMEVGIVYSAFRTQLLPKDARPGLVEQQALEAEARLMRMLMPRLMAFGARIDRRMTLCISTPVGNASTRRDDGRPLSLETLRQIRAMPKGARPPQMADLQFFDSRSARMIVADEVSRSLLAHLHTDNAFNDPDDEVATMGWRLGQLVEPGL